MSHHSSSVNGKGTSHKDPLSRILDELSSLKLWKEKAISPFSLRRRKGQIQREIALQYYLLNNLVERERERVMGGSEKGNMMGEIKNG